MIAVDTNVLVAAHRSDAPAHQVASEVVRSLAEGATSWGLPWPVIAEFHAVVTHPRIFREPSTIEQSVDQLDAWIGSPSVRLLSELGSTWTTLRDIVRAGLVRGPQVHDARIAAICLDHGVQELLSADRDFSRYPSLRTRNPLVAASRP